MSHTFKRITGSSFNRRFEIPIRRTHSLLYCPPAATDCCGQSGPKPPQQRRQVSANSLLVILITLALQKKSASIIYIINKQTKVKLWNELNCDPPAKRKNESAQGETTEIPFVGYPKNIRLSGQPDNIRLSGLTDIRPSRA